MRQKEFVTMIRRSFPIFDDHDLAGEIAEAMFDASTTGRGNIGSFRHDGKVYYVKTTWYDGCINYACNPATCYTSYELTSDA
jgi:hypothetical protein